MGAYGIWMMLSSLFSALFGGGAMYLFTVKSKKKEAAAQAHNAEAVAETTELNNVQIAIKIWREMAEKLQEELNEQKTKSLELIAEINKLSVEVATLNKEVLRLTGINTKILRIIDKINPEYPENYERAVIEMKKIIGNEQRNK